MNDEAFVRQCEAICRRGFANEHAWIAWFGVRKKRIYSLPVELAAKIVFAFRQSAPKEPCARCGKPTGRRIGTESHIGGWALPWRNKSLCWPCTVTVRDEVNDGPKKP